MKEYDYLVFIGRFQPFHLGHLEVVRNALTKAEQVIILVGSALQPRTTRNPWTVSERVEMIRSCFSREDNAKIHVQALINTTYNDELWVSDVQKRVKLVIRAIPLPGKVYHNNKIGLIGHSKDSSSYYLKLFPQWDHVEVGPYLGLNATDVRDALFYRQTTHEIQGADPLQVPENVRVWLQEFIDTPEFKTLLKEVNFIRKYKMGWSSAPYVPIFSTVDAVVVQSGHILLVERGASPGKGLLALPGGFVNPDETLLNACIRELREETQLKVAIPILKGSIKCNQVYDDPHRSERGRTITQAYYIELDPMKNLPKVKGDDDAKKAFWLPLSELKIENMFEDHYFIIKDLIGKTSS